MSISDSKRTAWPHQDGTLIERLRQGDREAFQTMVDQVGRKVFNLVLRMVRRRQEAEDLTQEIFFAAYRSIRTYRGDCSFYTWIYRVAVNRVLNHLRKKMPRWDSLDDPEPSGRSLQQQIPDWTSNPERVLEDHELRVMLDAAVDSLGEANRLVFVMREVQALDFETIADILQCKQDAVRARLHRAKKELKEILRPYLERGECRVPKM